MGNKKKPIIALMYDFDKTLCGKDMQDYSFIPSIGMNSSEFWQEANRNPCCTDRYSRNHTSSPSSDRRTRYCRSSDPSPMPDCMIS